MSAEENKKAEAPLPANCVEEEYLYVTMQRCRCGGTYNHQRQILTRRGGTPCDELHVRCKECGDERTFVFDIGAFFGDLSKYGRIVQPSKLFDVVEWLGLAAIFIRDSEMLAENDRRMMMAEADFCVDQALMFYEGDNDAPVDEAFFHQPDRKIAKERIGLVSRKHLLKLKERTSATRARQQEQEEDR